MIMSRAIIVVDLSFGDSGKGAHVDYLCRTLGSKTVVRFNGGGQAGHNVVTPDLMHHCFHHWGSGTLVGAKTFLSRYMMISPLVMYQEAVDLRIKGVPEAFKLLWADPRAQIVTPFDEALNQLRELARGDAKHGSCGMGIGEAAKARIDGRPRFTVADLESPSSIAMKLRAIQTDRYGIYNVIKDDVYLNPLARIPTQILEEPAMIMEVSHWLWNTFKPLLQVAGPYFLNNIMDAEDNIIFEGAQGVLLDERYGMWPHTTWSNCTAHNAWRLIQEVEDHEKQSMDDNVVVHGLIRAYTTRHGAGPFPTENKKMTDEMSDVYNPHNPWQGSMRFGHLDLMLTNYAMDCCAVDELVVSCIDDLRGREVAVCRNYDDGRRTLPLPFEGTGPNVQPDDRLTKYLEERVPQYETVSWKFDDDSVEPLCQIIEEATRMPVTVVSNGRTANDRKERVRV
jgi:adenylosuccinate synthase